MAGKKAKSRGDAWEGRIGEANSRYERRGEARAEHYGPATRRVRRPGGGVKVVVVGKAPPDVVALLVGGLYCAFEAKVTANKDKWTYPLRPEGRAEREHQYEALLRMRAVSGQDLFGYLVLWRAFKEDEECRWHHVRDVEYLIMPPRLVFRREEGVLVPWLRCGVAGVPDWLAALGVEP